MKKEYILVDDNNNWLATETSKEYLRDTLKEIKADPIGYFSGLDRDIPDHIYIYKAEEIGGIEIYKEEQDEYDFFSKPEIKEIKINLK